MSGMSAAWTIESQRRRGITRVRRARAIPRLILRARVLQARDVGRRIPAQERESPWCARTSSTLTFT
eukprot:scaffold135457_cov30-Tisochrysis_lutea.AAC.2